MKLNLALIAAVAADWNGQSEDAPCGMQLTSTSLVNSTCTITGSNIKAMYAGNGAFISGTRALTGFEGVSGDADVVVLFEQTCTDGDCDNSTCWDAQINCVENPNNAASPGMFFMETVNSASAGMINLQIAGAQDKTDIAITLVDDDGNQVRLTNITASGGSPSVSESNSGSFSIATGENFGQLLQVSVNTDAVVNLWRSTIA